MSAFDFSHSGCSFCHPGGGPLEYDREGYRYDGSLLLSGLNVTGANPAPKTGDYSTVASGALSSRAAAWTSGGVAEADCLMCHYITQYTQVDRNFAALGAAAGGYTQPQYAATLGLVGAGGNPGLFAPVVKAGNSVNPGNPASGAWLTAAVAADQIVAQPRKEACAVCHLVDKGWWANCTTTPTSPNCGPASKPMGATAWQRYMAPGTVADGDYSDTPNNKVEWKVAKGKPEGGKRAESINDTANPDAHMDNDKGAMTCSQCHYALSGIFPAVTNDIGQVVYPAVTVASLDHQFAKGNNLPDGKNMDQLDNTVTCAGCHIARTHPNSAGSPNPAAAHAAFPAVHFQVINCRTCHVPVLNGPQQWLLADFTVGPFRTFERNQVTENPAGVNYKPLYMWRKVAAEGDAVMIEPVVTTTVAIWADGTPLKPTFQRAAMTAAQARRTAQGYNATTFLANWPLNQAQGGDTALIANTTAEITDMVTRVATASGAATPVMNLYINPFDASHNIAVVGGGKILGSATGGGCIMCHSSSNPSSPNYSPKSIGFFDRTHRLFNNPVEDDTSCVPATTEGLVQTTVGGIRRVSFKLATKKPDGSDFTIDLANVPDCTPVRNTVGQAEVLGFDATALGNLTTPAFVGIPMPTATFGYTYGGGGQTVSFDAGGSSCPSGDCVYNWAFGDGGTGAGVTTTHAYAAGTWNATLTLLDNVNATQALKTVALNIAAIDLPPAAGSACTFDPNTWGLTVTDASTDDHGIRQVTVNWGDGTVIGNDTTGPLFGPFTHTFLNKGTYTVTHKAIDSIGQQATSTCVVSPATFTISGTVQTPLGGNLAGALVTVKKGVQTVGTGYSNALGNFAVGNLKPGTYTLTVTRSGYTFAVPAAAMVVGPNDSDTITALTGAGLAPRTPTLDGRKKPGRDAGSGTGTVDAPVR